MGAASSRRRTAFARSSAPAGSARRSAAGTEPVTAQPRHPVIRLGGTIGRLPRYVRLANALLHDPDVSKPRKAALAAGMAYLASPIDLVPGIIPVAGQLDDLAVVLYAIRTALRGLPADQGRRHLLDVGLAPTALAADIAIVREATGWTIRTVAAAGTSIASLSV